MTPPADSTKDDGGPAFPMEIDTEDSKGYPITGKIVGGMSLRDWFAGMALQGMVAQPNDHTFTWDYTKEVRQRLAVKAYQYADAMLAERNKP